MIRVLHSELQSNIGGIESFLLNLTKVIDKTNINFDILMKGNNPFLEKEFKKLGVKIYKVPSNLAQYIRFVKYLLKKNNYNFVYIHKNSAANILLPILVKKYSTAKLIVHSHNTNPSGGSKIAVILHKINRNKLYKLSDYRFACSNLAAKWMFGKDYHNKNVKIIKNGIITQNYVYNPKIRAEIREQLGLKNKFVIGHVGAFREQKNHKFLINVFSKLNISNARLVLVGDGPLKSKIEEQAKELGLSNKIKFLGSRNDVNILLQAFDIFAMPSLWEGLSIAVIEAQASGLNVIASDHLSSESKITDNIKFLPLEESLWVNEIKSVKEVKNTRVDESLKIKYAGYDMSSSAKIIQNILEKEK